MRLSDFGAIVLAFTSILFPTPAGLWGALYGLSALLCLVLSVGFSLNWQALPAYFVLFIRLVVVDYLHIRTSIYIARSLWNRMGSLHSLKMVLLFVASVESSLVVFSLLLRFLIKQWWMK